MTVVARNEYRVEDYEDQPATRENRGAGGMYKDANQMGQMRVLL